MMRMTVLLLIISTLILQVPHSSVNAANVPGSLTLQVVPLQTRVLEGKIVSTFVHTGAFAALTLNVRYKANLISTYHGIADRLGRFVFVWRVPKGMHLGGPAKLTVAADRGPLRASWSGTLAIQSLPLPRLFVQPLRPSFLAGTNVGIYVSTEPNTVFTFKVATDDGKAIANGLGTSDAKGRYVITVPESILPKAAIGGTASVTVTTDAGTQTRVSHFELQPRPPMALFVTTTQKAIRAGGRIGIFVSTRPGTTITISMAVTNTVVLTATGVTDKAGRWLYSVPVYVVLKHQHITNITVHATNGLDESSDTVSFILRPGPIGLTPYGFDRLATPSEPSPDLSKFFTSIPDKLIVVSTEGQVLRAYDHGMLVHENYVTTGRPELPTVHGIFHVYLKQTPFVFNSPWPPGSPYYYPPSPVRYWMPFYEGYGLHDSPWRSVYGPGTNLPHYSTDPGEPVGSHGCVNIPLVDTIWLWNWTTVGTTVLVY